MLYLVALFNLVLPNVSQVRVLVIDTGLDIHDKRFTRSLCPEGHIDFTHTTLNDTDGHGTHVTGLIVANAGNLLPYCITVYKVFDEDGTVGYRFITALQYATIRKFQIINLSLSGEGFSSTEMFLFKALEKQSTIITVAAGNNGMSLDTTSFFPASYNTKNMHIVGNLQLRGLRNTTSNYGDIVRYWEVGTGIYSTLPNGKYGYMTGTSMSTALETANILRGQ